MIITVLLVFLCMFLFFRLFSSLFGYFLSMFAWIIDTMFYPFKVLFRVGNRDKKE